MAQSGAVMTAMVTPIRRATGASTRRRPPTWREWLVDQGNDGLVLSGTTGESPTLTDDEKMDLLAGGA